MREKRVVARPLKPRTRRLFFFFFFLLQTFPGTHPPSFLFPGAAFLWAGGFGNGLSEDRVGERQAERQAESRTRFESK